jgi:hypothetical protein
MDVHTSTQVKLDEANFVTVRTNVVGISKGFKLLGFITFKSATLNKAMNQLYENAELEHGRPQTLAHLIVEHSGIYVILFSIPQVSARADLIEFIPPQQEQQEEEEDTGPHSSGVQRVKHHSRPTPPDVDSSASR